MQSKLRDLVGPSNSSLFDLLKNEARRELRFTSFTSPEALLVNDFV
jgi:hypothetical protein